MLMLTLSKSFSTVLAIYLKRQSQSNGSPKRCPVTNRYVLRQGKSSWRFCNQTYVASVNRSVTLF